MVNIKGSKTLNTSSFYNPKTPHDQSINWFDKTDRTASKKNASFLRGSDYDLQVWDWKKQDIKTKHTTLKIHYEFGYTLDDTCLLSLIEDPSRKKEHISPHNKKSSKTSSKHRKYAWNIRTIII